MDKKVSVAFVDKSIQEAYFETREENPKLYKFLERATDDIKKDPFYGIQIPKKLIPRTYKQKYGIDNYGNTICPMHGG